MNNEIVIGDQYTSILQTDTEINDLYRNENYDEENVVIHKPIIRKRTVNTRDFFSKLQNKFTTENEILPSGCKYIKNINNGYKILVVEEPPRIRTILTDIGMESTVEKLKLTGKLKEYNYENYLNDNTGVPYSFQLSFPYVIFIILLNNNNELITIKPFFRLHPISSLSDYLFLAPLYNIPKSQSICLGGVENFGSINESIENIIETFWLNRYNNDYTDNIRDYNKSDAYEVHDYLSWMYFSKLDPMFIYNVKWIKHEDNIGQIIYYMVRDYANNDSTTLFTSLRDSVFYTTSEKLNPDPTTKNSSYQVVIKNDTISIGDEIIFEDKPYYLYSLITKNNNYDFDSIELEDNEGILMQVPFNDFVKGYKSIFKPNFIEEVEVNGNVIKPGSIINCKIGDYNVYKKIKSIRKGLDGKIEAIIGTDHYLIENIDFENVDISDIKINGKIISESDKFQIIQNNENYSPTYKTIEVEFEGVTIQNDGAFVLKFLKINSSHRQKYLNINFQEYQRGDSSYDFVNEDDFIDADVSYSFDKIIINTSSNDSKFKIIKNKGFVIKDGYNMNNYSPSDISRKSILEKILLEEGTKLHIPSAFIDIDFKVGDPIIYANWDNPEDMLTISSIDSFEYDEDGDMIYVNSTSLNKKIQYKIPYINLDNYRINIGIIRKVESKCGEWKSGDKIKANTTGVVNFPKKDTNTIIAFINDGSTKYPLALCSNLCTIWMNEETVNKFDMFPLKSKQWNKFENVEINLSKIKWQHGDNFASNTRLFPSHINFLARRSGTMNGFEHHYSMNNGVLEWGSRIGKSELDQYYKRHGFIMPRIAISKSFAAASGRGFPNMLGGMVRINGSRIFLRSEQLKEDF